MRFREPCPVPLDAERWPSPVYGVKLASRSEEASKGHLSVSTLAQDTLKEASEGRLNIQYSAHPCGLLNKTCWTYVESSFQSPPEVPKKLAPLLTYYLAEFTAK